MPCSLARTLEIIGDWWTPLILRSVFLGVVRFDDLVEDLGVSRNLLTARLKTLVDNGLLERRPYQDNPPRHEYALAEAGRALVPALMALTAWGDEWVTPKGGPPVLFTHKGCGKLSIPTVSCSHCGEPLEAHDVIPRVGPGGKASRGTKVVARRLREA